MKLFPFSQRLMPVRSFRLLYGMTEWRFTKTDTVCYAVYRRIGLHRQILYPQPRRVRLLYQSRLLEAGDNSNLRAMKPDRAVRGETELILIHSPSGTRLWTRVPVAWRAVQSLVDGFALYSPLGFVVSFCLYTLPDLAGGYLVIYLWSWSRT